MATPEALITVQETQRLLFRHMIDAGINPEEAMKIMACWMWLESQGFKELVKKISSHDAKFLTLVSEEAEAVMASLQPYSTTPTSHNLMPITSNLTQCCFSVEDTFVVEEAIKKGIQDFYNKSCCMLFEDILEERGIKVGSRKVENGATIAKALTRWINGEGSSEQGAWLGGNGFLGSPPDEAERLELPSSGGDGEEAQPTAPLVRHKLNPFAKEWNPKTKGEPEEFRCLFLTFSNGYPLSEPQIVRFFTDNYGPCVERVYVHRPEKMVPPLFGKVVFTESYIPAVILSGQNESRFIIDGRSLWCKKFEPTKMQRHANGRTTDFICQRLYQSEEFEI